MTEVESAGEFVFGYGSLLSGDRGAERLRPGAAAYLSGYRRAWNVAMDNTVDLPDYKYYRAPDGSRPELFVAFLNLVPAAGHRVNGITFEVTPEDLCALDRRERNYERVEVTELLQGKVAGRVWTYIGTSEARGRFELGVTSGLAAVCQSYHDEVLRGFAALGDDAATDFEASTEPPACPVRELARVELSEPARIV